MIADFPTAVIMTALDLEYRAVRSHLSNLRSLIHPAGTVYESGIFACEEAQWRVILAETGVGNNIAAIETSRALDAFHPTVAMFVGIAGGLKDVSIGDVVAADYIYGYESSKVTETFNPRIKTFGCGYPLVQQVRAIRREDQWHKRITSGDLRPTAFVGPIASGEQVLAARNTPTHELLEKHCGDTLAVETEGWGFLFAAHTNGDVPSIVIRGISDLTFDKTPEQDLTTQPMAADHAVAFAFELLATFQSANPTRSRSTRRWRPKLT